MASDDTGPNLESDTVWTPEPDLQRLKQRAGMLAPIHVTQSLRSVHPLLKSTKAWYDGRTESDGELIRGRQLSLPHPLQIVVSRAQLLRALLLMDTIFKAVKKLGGTIEAPLRRDWESALVRVTLAGEAVATLRLRERYKQVKATPSADSTFSREWVCRPQGLLVLDSGPAPSASGVHCEDRQGGKKIEDQLDVLLQSWVDQACQTRASRRAQEQELVRQQGRDRLRQAEEAERERVRQDLRERQRIEQTRVDELVEEARRWHRAQALRSYVRAIEEHASRGGGTVADLGKTQDWLRWARDQADRLDPLTPSPGSVLDDRV